MGLGKRMLKAYQNGRLTDVELILVDVKGNTKKMAVHKVVLSISCEYFETMFERNFEDKNKKELVLRDLPDANIIHDIIQQFYGNVCNTTTYPDWYYKLQMIRCKKFLMIDANVHELYEINIPNGGFDELLDIIHTCFGYTEDTLNLLVNNLPEDYDLDKLSPELVRAMYDFVNNIVVATIDTNGCLNIINAYGKKIKLKQMENNHVYACCFYGDKITHDNNIAIACRDEKGSGKIASYCLYGYNNEKSLCKFKETAQNNHDIHPFYGGNIFLLKDGSSFSRFHIKWYGEGYFSVNTSVNNDNSYSVDTMRNRFAVLHKYYGQCDDYYADVREVEFNDFKLLHTVSFGKNIPKIFLYPDMDILITCTSTQITLWNIQRNLKIHETETDKKVMSIHFFSKFRFMAVFEDGSAKIYGITDEQIGTHTNIDPLRYWQMYGFKHVRCLPNFHPHIKGVCDGTNLVTYDDTCIKIWDKYSMEPSSTIKHDGNVQKIVCQNSPRHKNTKKLCKYVCQTKNSVPNDPVLNDSVLNNNN